MIHSSLNKNNPKGWFIGPWNSKLEIPIGYANEGIKENHVHSKMNEIYLIAKGSSTIRIAGKEIILREGDILVVEPGEEHTFLNSTDGYLHFVIHTPFIKDDKRVVE